MVPDEMVPWFVLVQRFPVLKPVLALEQLALVQALKQ